MVINVDSVKCYRLSDSEIAGICDRAGRISRPGDILDQLQPAGAGPLENM